MEYTEVKSSKLIKLGYDRNKSWLEVHFKNGHIYRFKEVPPKFYMECLVADSVGKYFFNNIYDVFPFEILE